jgi:hypothetical protein
MLSGARVVAFIVSVLLVAEAVEPMWGWYAALLVSGLLFAFTISGFVIALIGFLLLVGIANPAQSWFIVLTVLSSLAMLRFLRAGGGEGPRRRRGWRRGFDWRLDF